MSHQLSNRQLDIYWMPGCANREFKAAPRIVNSASGCWLTDDQQRRVFDAMSGNGLSGLGHCHPEIAAAITQQLGQLDNASGFQTSHPAAFRLAEQLLDMMDMDMGHVFLSGSGPDAGNTAATIARQFWQKQGAEKRSRITDLSSPETENTTASETLQKAVYQYGAEYIAAVWVRPELLASADSLRQLHRLCSQHNILLIADERNSALGRMGSMSLSRSAGIIPDLLITSGQLTNGAVPAGAVICSEDIYDIFMEHSGAGHQVELGNYSQESGHPLACAAALKTLELLGNNQLTEKLSGSIVQLKHRVDSLGTGRGIDRVRQKGLSADITLTPGEDRPARAWKAAMICWQKGFYVRYSESGLHIAPPFLSTAGETDRLVNAIGEAASEASASTSEPEPRIAAAEHS